MFSLIYTTFKVDRDYKVVVVSFLYLFFHKHRLRELLRINTIYVLNKKWNFKILGQKKKKVFPGIATSWHGGKKNLHCKSIQI